MSSRGKKKLEHNSMFPKNIKLESGDIIKARLVDGSYAKLTSKFWDDYKVEIFGDIELTDYITTETVHTNCLPVTGTAKDFDFIVQALNDIASSEGYIKKV